MISTLKSFKGIIKVFVHRTSDLEISFDDRSNIHGFLWVTPWAIDAIQKFQYIELDGTFEIAKPYVLSCPQIIVNGISLPLGFIVGPQENWTLFNCFYEEIANIMGDNAAILKLPVLLDQGPGIQKFCTELQIVQYFCIRHIINTVGANSYLGKLTGRLLMSQTKEYFDRN